MLRIAFASMKSSSTVVLCESAMLLPLIS